MAVRLQFSTKHELGFSIGFFLLFLPVVLFAASPVSQPSIENVGMSVAVVDFQVQGFEDKGIGTMTANLIIDSLNKTRKYTMQERLSLNKLIEEQKLSLSGLIDENTAAKIGKFHGVEGVVVGNVMKYGTQFIITARLVNVKTASILYTATIKVKSIDELADKMGEVAAQLSTENLSAFLFDAVTNGDVEFVRNYKGNINQPLKDGGTALMWAANKGNTAMINALVEAKADINGEDNKGNTALIWAADKGQADAVKVLIKSGARVNAINNNGETVLMCAVYGKNINVINALIEAGADVNAGEGSKHGTTLIYAASYGRLDAVKVLIKAGVRVNATNFDGDTALIQAAGQDNPEMIKVLIKAGADVNARANNGITALMRATYNGKPDVVKALIDEKADVNATNNNSSTALISAANGGYTDVVNLLLKAGADVNAIDKDGMTALMWAVALDQDKTDTVKALIKAKADPNAVDSKGGTALIRAVEHGKIEAVKALIEGKVDVNYSNNGFTAMRMANLKENAAMINLLKKAGAK
jgi:ankyrin repeat protein